MDVIYGLLPGMLVMGLAAVAVLFWAARTGQFDDLDGDGRRILMDEDEDLPDVREASTAAAAHDNFQEDSGRDGDGDCEDEKTGDTRRHAP